MRVCERYRVRFQVFPHLIQQFSFFRSGEAVDLVAQIAHMPLTLARFPRWRKRRKAFLISDILRRLLSPSTPRSARPFERRPIRAVYYVISYLQSYYTCAIIPRDNRTSPCQPPCHTLLRSFHFKPALASLSFQSLARSFIFRTTLIPFPFFSLHTLCEKHRGYPPCNSRKKDQNEMRRLEERRHKAAPTLRDCGEEEWASYGD